MRSEQEARGPLGGGSRAAHSPLTAVCRRLGRHATFPPPSRIPFGDSGAPRGGMREWDGVARAVSASAKIGSDDKTTAAIRYGAQLAFRMSADTPP